MATHTESLAMHEGNALPMSASAGPNWLTNARVLWGHRVFLLRLGAIALVVVFGLVFLIPKRYESTARIMPPERSGSDTAMFAALAGRALGGDMLGSLAASMLGAHNSGALFVELLKSGSVTGYIIERFQLMSVYHARYRVDAAKTLLRRTTILQ